MTREEKIAAFTMYIDGKTWADIGRELNYTPQAIKAALFKSLEKHPYTPVILYPVIRQYVFNHCGGSVSAFADELGVSHSRLRRVLFCGDPASDSMTEKITSAIGKTAREVFKQ